MNPNVAVLWASMMLAATAASQTIRPDCEAYCGNVSIPYPFGTTEGCYLNQDFFINCTHNSTHRWPLLWNSNIEVQKIMLEDHELRVLTYVGRKCYNETGHLTNNTYAFGSLGDKHSFLFSNKRNKFTAVGCDTVAAFRGVNVTTGCLSICNNTDRVINGSCSGIGCCQTSIPKDISQYRVDVYAYNNHSFIMEFNPCSYTFLVEENSFNFTMADLKDLRRNKVPTVLDWAVGDQTCEAAQKNPVSYACKDNTRCNMSDNGPGYRCYCSSGFQGNPYLPNGCKDVDECGDPSHNQCTKICTNTHGSYACSCPKFYHGDGRRDGEGCIADDSLLSIKIAIGISASFLALIIGSSWLFWVHKRRKFIRLKEKFFRQNGGLMLQQHLSRREGSSETIRIFSTEELEKATDKYAESKIIGHGGYGTVYKGTLTDGRIVAIKKSMMVDTSQIEQFINEVLVVSQINHRNVVKLLGCCLETAVPLLIYEFIPNGTLFDYIHNEKKTFTISWEVRLRIATEIAEVLSYLHSAASTPIIHRDVKSTNILLDDNYTAKVSDFGASRLVPLDQTQLSTMVQGTLGYLDPEYLLTSQLTEKSDVYSFGVVLVELLTAEKALSFDRPEEKRSLAMHFLSSLKGDRLLEVLDERIVNRENIEQLKETANLAKRCLKLKGDERPSMKEVAMTLQRMRMVGTHPWMGHYSEESECLLGESSHLTFDNQDNSGFTNTAYDSLRGHLMLPVNDGR